MIYEKKNIESNLWPDLYIFGRIPKKSKILDIGCGSGKLSVHLASMGHEVYGIDHNLELIQQANKRVCELPDCKCNFTFGSAANLPFPDDFFDVVVLEAVLTTVVKTEHRQKILNGANRVVHNGGFIYLAEFAQNWAIPDYENRYKSDYHRTKETGVFIVRDKKGNEIFKAKHFNKSELIELMRQAEFEIESLRKILLTSMTGNKIDGYQIIAKKHKRERNPSILYWD